MFKIILKKWKIYVNSSRNSNSVDFEKIKFLDHKKKF